MYQLIRKTVCIVAAVACSQSFLGAEEYVTRSEYDALSRQVKVLELEVRRMQNMQVDALSQRALEVMPESAAKDAALIEKVVDAMHTREQAINYPWMDLTKWQMLRKGMTPGAVVDILGLPTLNEPSMHKRVDNVYTYRGRQPSTGKRVVGLVRFYKSKAVEIELPVLD